MTFLENVTVEPVLFLYMLATYMQYAVYQDLIYIKACEALYNTTVCELLNEPENDYFLDQVQHDASMWIMISTIALAIPSMVTANILGSWGDSNGRKLPLLVPSIGGILNSFVCIWMSSPSLAGPVWLIVVASFFSGLFGGFVSCSMAVVSYISSISSDGTRTARVSLLEAMSFVGGTIGPFIGGAIQKTSGHVSVFIAIIICHLLLILYVFIYIDEKKDVSEESKEDRLGYCNHIQESFMTCLKERENNKRKSIILLLMASLLIMTITAGELDISFLYAKDNPLRWDYQMFSYYFGLKYAIGSLILVICTPIIKYFNISDFHICYVGIISKIAGLVLLSFSNKDYLMFLVPFVASFSSFCIPALRALLSKLVEPHELGKMFAIVASIENLCTLFGSVLFNSFYPPMKNIHRGLIFQIAAALHVAPMLIICFFPTSIKKPTIYQSLPAT